VPTATARTELLAGAKAVAPMLVGVIPFGLVAGATPATTGLGGGAAIGLSTIVFAGASQLAAADVLADGGSALVAVIAACTINLRLLLYSASLAPHLAAVPLRRRLLMGYLLTDQAYAVSITRWTKEADDAAAGGPPAPGLERKVPYYFGAALLLWGNWQVCTIIGILIGSAVPDSLPLDFAVPLVFLVLLVPAITSRPAAVAGIVGGGLALAAHEAGAGHLAVLFGALGGIAAGAWAVALFDRRGARDDTPLPPDPSVAP
jgi:predicted branched-subunit amino acid permease